MKGQTITLSRYGLFLINVVILIGILLIIYSIITNNTNTDQQNVRLNTERLIWGIREACNNNNGIAQLKDFEFPQSTLNYNIRVAGRKDVFGYFDYENTLETASARIQAKLNGDPNYILYYEAFPPAEGIDWEIYMDAIHYRIFKKSDTASASTSLINANMNQGIYSGIARGTGSEKFSEIIIDEVLSDSSYIKDLSENDEKIKIPFMDEDQGNIGMWIDNFYRFFDYSALSTYQKSAIKYMPCCKNCLCLKTRTGIYRYDLSDACNNLKYIQIVLDKEIKREGAVDLDPANAQNIEHFSDFYLASPCKADLKIEYLTLSECLLYNCGYESTYDYGKSCNKIHKENYLMTKDGKKHGEHIIMTEKFIDSPKTPITISTLKKEKSCIRITITPLEDETYCNGITLNNPTERGESAIYDDKTETILTFPPSIMNGIKKNQNAWPWVEVS